VGTADRNFAAGEAGVMQGFRAGGQPPRARRGSPSPRIGAHVSVAGGLLRALERARRIGAEALQVFPSNPRQWLRPAYPEEELGRFRAALGRSKKPLAVHTIYLINLASPEAELRRKSARALADALTFGARAGARAVVTHVGSHRGDGFEAALGRVSAAVREALERAAAEAAPRPLPPLLLETSAGSAGSVGASPEELGRLLAELPETAGVCLDTAHLFAAGYPVHTRHGCDGFLADLDRRVGLARVGLIHLNDSRSALGSRRDRHENLGEGAIGAEGLALWVRHPALRAVPFVLETPGFDDQGPDRKNLETAKALRRRAETDDTSS
jgi:deoxyribonuclease-4